MDLTHIFGRFAGIELATQEKDVVIKGKTFRIPRLKDENHPVLAEMEKAAKDNGLSLRVWFQGTGGTIGDDEKRVNAFVEETKDGRWFISKTFFLG